MMACVRHPLIRHQQMSFEGESLLSWTRVEPCSEQPPSASFKDVHCVHLLELASQNATDQGAQTTETYSLPVLKAGRLRSGRPRATRPLKAPGKNLFPASLLTPGGSLACGCMTPPAYGVLPVCPSPKCPLPVRTPATRT